MSGLVVASQLNDQFNALLAQRLPDATIQPLAPGVPDDVPETARVLVAIPFRKAGQPFPPRPAGWPFNLKLVQLASSGIDFYPDWLFEGTPVASARGTSANALAEFALAGIFAAAKRLPEIWINQPDQWAHKPLGSVRGSVLGIVGLGAAGAALAQLALALGMRVVAVRRSDSPSPVAGVELAADLPSLFAQADHLVLAAPLTPETHHLVNDALLRHAKPGLHLINIARGALVDDDALLAALEDGRLSRATLDVTHPEPLPAGHPFYHHPRVHLSPHTSVLTPDQRDNLAAKVADNLIRFTNNQPLADLIDRQRGY